MTLTLRLRFPELLENAGISAWGLHKLSKGRITAPTAYRLVRAKGAMNSFPRETLEALCDVLGVNFYDLWEYKKLRVAQRHQVPVKAVKTSAKKAAAKTSAKTATKKTARKAATKNAKNKRAR